jgi:hypothetical protein
VNCVKGTRWNSSLTNTPRRVRPEGLCQDIAAIAIDEGTLMIGIDEDPTRHQLGPDPARNR